MAISDYMPQTQQQQGPQTPGMESLAMTFNQQQAQQASQPGDEADIIQKMQDPNVREEVAAMLAAEGIEPPGTAQEIFQPVTAQDMGQNVQTNPQLMQGMMQNLMSTQQNTMEGQNGTGA